MAGRVARCDSHAMNRAVLPSPSCRRLVTRLAAGIGTSLALTLAPPVMAQVGMSTFALPGMPVTLVYPTEASAVTTQVGPFALNVARDAAPRTGPHRLVVLSHGTGGNPLPDHALARSLVKAGFVVAQPLHRGDNFNDTRQAGTESFHQRPLEVLELIDALARDPAWSARLRLDRIGVHGMSAGGVTALALAGGQWRTLDIVRHCNEVGEDDAGFCFNGAVTSEARQRRADSFARARGVPELFLPAGLKQLHGGRTPQAPGDDARLDPRIASVTVAVPVAAIFTPQSLARITVPVGVVSASADLVLVPRFHSDRLLRACAACTPLARLEGAGHFDVLWPWPDVVAREVAARQVRGGLPTPGFEARERDAARQAIVQFHLQHLGGMAPTPR
jgi:predicted dienelactone hydrolase